MRTSDPNDVIMTEHIGHEHYVVCILRPDQIDLIAEAVVRRMTAPAVTHQDDTGVERR